MLIGDRAWNIGNPWIEIEEVEIASCPLEESSTGVVYYETRGITFPGSGAVIATDLFKSKEEAIKEIERRKNKKKEEISNQIHSVEDLLNIMFASMYCAEYVDYEKIEVVKRKAKELLGMELKR